MLIIDSREKQWEHIKDYLERNNIPYQVTKLDVGDYMNTEHPNIVIDRKANLQEVCSNLQSGKENIHRFMKECRRARDNKIELVVLIEGTKYKDLTDAKLWKSKYTQHTGDWLVRQMKALIYAFDIQWKFCKRNETAKKILEILHYEGVEDNGR